MNPRYALLRSKLNTGDVVWCGLVPVGIDSEGATIYELASSRGGQWRADAVTARKDALADESLRPTRPRRKKKTSP